MQDKLRLVGDVHGNIAHYVDLVKNFNHSIQLGDLGFRYKPEILKLDSKLHKVIAGNHDNYEENKGVFVNQTDHFLGDYGLYQVDNFDNFFFIRGGESIDKSHRLVGYNWWADEELSYDKCMKALNLYCEIKPKIVISHECPEIVIHHVSGLNSWNGKAIMPSRTSILLQRMFEKYQPKFWFFGHHHKSWTMMIDGTRFRCLAELETFDIEKGGLQ